MQQTHFQMLQIQIHKEDFKHKITIEVNLKMRTTGWERCHLKEGKNVGGK